MIVQWRLTEKGKDTLPILMQLVAFGCKWYSDVDLVMDIEGKRAIAILLTASTLAPLLIVALISPRVYCFSK
jgi:hypothetical protein